MPIGFNQVIVNLLLHCLRALLVVGDHLFKCCRVDASLRIS